MTVFYVLSKILTFPGALTKALFEQIMCRIFKCPVEDNRYLRTDKMCGHIEHEAIKSPVKSYLFCFIPGLLNFLLGCTIGLFPLVNILNLGNYSGFVVFPQELSQSVQNPEMLETPAKTLDLAIIFFFAWVSISLLSNLFPIIKDAVIMKEQYKNLPTALKIIFFPGYIGMQVGARLEKFGLTFLILIALTVFAVMYPGLYIPLVSQIAIIPSKISAFINKIYLDAIYR